MLETGREIEREYKSDSVSSQNLFVIYAAGFVLIGFSALPWVRVGSMCELSCIGKSVFKRLLSKDFSMPYAYHFWFLK